MTAPAPVDLVAEAAPAVRTTRRRAPALLWGLAVLAVVPALVPIGLLAWTVLDGGITTGISTRRLLELMWSTALLVGAVTATAGILGVATAWLTTRTDLSGRRAWSIVLTLPLVIPSYVGAIALLGASGSRGMLTTLLAPIGLGPVPTFRGFWAAWAALSLWNYPFVHLLAVPSLRRMDPALEEAARGLGASRRRTFLTVVFPQLRPALAASGLLVALYTLSDFGAVSLLGYETFTRAIYTQFRGRLDVGPALYLSGVLVLIALVLVAFERRTRGRMAYHADRPTRPARRWRLLGGTRVVAVAFLATLTALALVLPATVLAWWTVRGLRLGVELGSVLTETFRSAFVSSLAAAVIALAAIPLAIVTVRHRNRLSGALESTAWATYSLPHLAVGLAFLVLALRALPLLYQSITLLVIAYVAMFLPQALGATQAALRQVGPHLEEASRSLGHSGATTLRRIVLPLIAPGLAAGATLVFLTVMKELPATLLLRPTGFETLAVRIWSAASEGLYTRASAASLVLLAVSTVPLYLLVSREPE
ncbi:MAG: iron ABC transporter permease [Acidimicrobiia bacterium]|jgi:iron(III) transport system permease protein